ncbi:MAG: HEAT repeat domain-containing protein [Planctomycetota bacterium]|nr:HEAT repeat domain-containing protein [Planctomycetota bacterium]
MIPCRRLLLAAVLFGAAAAGCRPSGAAPRGPDEDYRDELPRIPPREPAESLAAFGVNPGFRMELVAAEPLVADPVAVSFDARGRMYVVCMRGYSEQADDRLGEIRLLEDRDGDGRYDASSVFVDGLSWPTGVFCYDGGIFVAVAPDIRFYRDTDGDGEADEERVVFTGFGRGNVQGLLNSLTWGLDNRIHGATSSSGGTVRAVEGAARGRAVALRGRDFAFDPRTGVLEATSGGAQHGLSFDDWGRKFVCSNSRHIEAVLFEERYARRNPFLPAPGPRELIAADGGQAEVFRESPVEPWRIVRTRLRVAGSVSGPVEGGGRAAGYFTGATGVTIYRGDAWPPSQRGQAIIGDVGSNIVHRKALRPKGVSFVAERLDRGRELVTSKEIWFRPVQFANAPDGSLHVLDMYREVIEHPKSLPPIIKKHLDLTSGRDRGRIYRLVPDGFSPRPPPRLDTASTAELVATLGHANAWHRETAARLLFERQDPQAVPLLEKVALESPSALGRLHALYALDGSGSLTSPPLLAALGAGEPRLREHAVRLAERLAASSAAVREALYGLVDDADLRVRYQLAFTLGELPGERRVDALARLARRDGGDRWMRFALLSSLTRGAGQVLEILARDRDARRTEGGKRMLSELASLIGRQSRKDAVAAALRAVESLSGSDGSAAAAILEDLGRGLEKSGSPLRELLREGQAGALLGDLLRDARRAAVDPEKAPDERSEAVRVLGLGNFAEEREVLERLLVSREPRAVQVAALAALSRFDAPDVASMVLGAWPGFSPRVRSRAVDVLFARRQRVLALLDAAGRGDVALADLGPSRLELLRRHPDRGVRERATKVFSGGLVLRERRELVASYRESLKLPADPERGKEVFRKVCSPCHRLGKEGNDIGPGLASVRGAGTESILLAVLDPNREVDPRYLDYVVLTRDGRLVNGVITAETATSITLRRAGGEEETILRLGIESLRSSGRSIMPEGLENDVDRQAMADLIAFILSAE